MATGKDYSALAKQRIRNPGEGERMPRLLVYGRNKKGKTKFANTAPDVLVLDPDDQPEALRPTWPINRWEDVNEAYLFLRTMKHKYKWVSIDGITKIYGLALRWVMKQAEERSLDKQPVLVGKQHYGRANDKIKDMLYNFHSLRDLGIVITAQEKMVGVVELDEMDDEEATPTTYQYIVDLPKGARSALNAMVDLTGRIYVVKAPPGVPFIKKVRRKGEIVEVEYTRQRRLLIGVDDMYETGYRSEHDLPDFIENPTVTKVVKAMKEGVIK